MLPTVEESRGYDFQDPENAEKWRGMFVNSLRKVLEQVHPTLTAEESALEYVESLCLRLLAMLCAVPSPLTVQDVEERVSRTFPTPLDKWAVADAREAVAARKRKGLMPYEKLHHMLQKEVLLYKIDVSVSIFITAILECVSADMLKLAGNFVKKISHKSGYETVTSRDIKTAMCADKVLMDMFYQDSELAMADASAGADKKKRGSLTYSELVRDLMTDERNFLRELNLIIRVFKEEIEKILDNDSRAISLIFGNIVDIYELTVTLLGNLEDACEMAQDSPTPYIGSCFEELAEVEEFRAYVRYANIVTRKESRDALQNIVDDPVLSERLDTAGHGFRLAVKYYLPKLLLAPVGHVFLYHSYVLTLLQIAPAHDDRESFKQVECNLHPITKILQKALGNGPKMDATLRMASRARRQLAVEKCNELARLVDNWDNREIGQCCNEFIREDTLSKIGPGKRIAERRAYLFDGLLLLCKPINSIVGVNSSIGGGAGAGHQLKVKERLHVRKLDLLDRPDTDEFRNVVELCPRVGGAVLLSCGSCVEKRHWLADLVMLNTKPMLDRTLDSILLDLERRHPLRLPAVWLYRFAVPDSPDNIVFEDRPRGTSPVPLIKGATLLKLIERLTYHVYADLALVRTFLTTYRSFCSPMELLDLLIERFNIPEPNEVYDAPKIEESIESVCGSDVEKLSKSTAREDWKRYRKEFQQPVKFRVINVLRHWVDQHFYDFERDDALHDKLRDFLETVEGKPMKKWVQSVLKTMQRKKQASCADSEGCVSHVFDRPAPALLPHPPHPPIYRHHPLALHPIELARQLTLFEFHLYRMVRPSELVGAVWTKKDKEKTSPNLLRIIKHTTNFTRWIEKWIVESENLEERAAVVCRFLEVAVALRELNNFNGVVAVVAACGSAAVHRLRATFQMVPVRLVRALEELRGLNCDHFKRYQAQLRSINPPCVPFLGMYLTNILHIEEGNLDYLPNSELINLSKRRKVAEITGEIQQYQNQPYCLTVEPNTRAFLESLDPFPGMDDNEITNYLYSKSLEIEPRPPVKQMPKFPRQYPELSLKPVKVPRRALEEPQRYAHHTHTHTHTHSQGDNISLSQVSPPGWDGQSVASLQLHSEHRGSRSEDRWSVVSPCARSERAAHLTSSSQLSLLDKGLALFDKTKSTASLNIKSREEPSSPLERHSPRHERHPSTVSLPCGPSGGTMGPQGVTIGPQGERRALSPRSAIVDADVFYARPPEHLSRISLNTVTDVGAERVPPLLPRSSMTASTATLPTTALQASCSTGASSTGASGTGASAEEGAADSPHDEKPPLLPPRDSLHNSSTSSEPPEPPDRPLPSPKHQELIRVGGMSPKRSPAPRPPLSPAVLPHPPPPSSANPLATTDRWSSGGAFRFPAKGPPTPSPPPHLHQGPGTPPPLPPRRRKDSLPPPTPIHQGAPLSSESMTGSSVRSTSPVGGGACVCVGVSPPPLPPRPPPAPQLLRPAHSTILQRRTKHTDHEAVAPRLPPKPPPALTPRP